MQFFALFAPTYGFATGIAVLRASNGRNLSDYFTKRHFGQHGLLLPPGASALSRRHAYECIPPRK